MFKAFAYLFLALAIQSSVVAQSRSTLAWTDTTNRNEPKIELLTKSFRQLKFEENKGQIADDKGVSQPEVLFTMKDKGVTLFFYKDGIRYRWHTQHTSSNDIPVISEATGASLLNETNNGPKSIQTFEMKMTWENSNNDVKVTAHQPTKDYSNYYLAHIPNGVTNVKSYMELTYSNLYPGIDARYYMKDGHLKYDLIVHKGANVGNVKMNYSKMDYTSMEAGAVKIATPLGEIVESKPVAYTTEGDSIRVNYQQLRNGLITFNVEDNTSISADLVIDPILTWRTYFGGTGDEYGLSTAANSNGNVFMSGKTTSTSGIASGGYQTSIGGSWDAFLVKYDRDGGLIWSTYYGGAGDDIGSGCAADAWGSSFIGGQTSSSGIASGGHLNTYQGGGYDAFLVKFNSAGTRMWATYYGDTGEDIGRSISVDNSNSIFLVGQTSSTTGISTLGSTGGGYEAFAVKFNTLGVRQWGKYFGAAGSDYGYSSCVADGSTLFIGGYTNSPSGISTNGTSFAGVYDAFIAKIDVSSGSTTWASYYGGSSEDYGYAVASDHAGGVYLAGETKSSSGLTGGGSDTTYDLVTGEGFLVRFNGSGTALWGSYIDFVDKALACTVDSWGTVYAGGPVGIDSQWLEFTPTGESIPYSDIMKVGDRSEINTTIICSFAADNYGNVYAAGTTSAVPFTPEPGIQPYIFGDIYSIVPVRSGGYQNSNAGGRDALMIKMHAPKVKTGFFDGCEPNVFNDKLGNVFRITYNSNNNSSTVGKYNSGGGTVWSVTLPNVHLVRGVADANGDVYVTGSTSATTGIAVLAHQTTYGGGSTDGVIACLYRSTGVLQWETYHGGSGDDKVNDVAISADGFVHIVGETTSTNNIASLGTYQTTLNGSSDAFAARFTTTGGFQWGSYYGGPGNDYGYAICTDSYNHMYVAGKTTSTSGIAASGYQTTFGGSSDGFIIQASLAGGRIWATYYGGTGDDMVNSLTADASGNIFATGSTASSSGVASSGGSQTTYGGAKDTYLVKFDNNGVRQWATYFGGAYAESDLSMVDTDASGNVYLAGGTLTDSGIFDNVIQAYPNNDNPNSGDGFIAKYNSSGIRLASTLLGVPGIGTGDVASVALESNGDIWIGGGGNPMKLMNFRDGRVVELVELPLAANTICCGVTVPVATTPATITGSTITGGIGTLTYQWQISTDNISWSSVSGGTYFNSNRDYQPSPSLIGHNYFRRKVSDQSGFYSSYSTSVDYNYLNTYPVGSIITNPIITGTAFDATCQEVLKTVDATAAGFSSYRGGSGNDVYFKITGGGGLVGINSCSSSVATKVYLYDMSFNPITPTSVDSDCFIFYRTGHGPNYIVMIEGTSSNGTVKAQLADYDYGDCVDSYTGFGFGRISGDSQLLVYPNPAENNATLTLTPSNDETTKISVYNKMNRLVKSFETKGNTVTFSVEDLSPDTYYIKVEGAKRSETHRLVVK